MLPRWAVPSVVILACALGYLQTMTVGFLADDYVILNNIKNGAIIEFGAGKTFLRPFVWLTFSLNWFITGHNAIGFHIVNLLLHIAATLGVAACAGILLRRKYAGLLAGLIFAIHPAHPEAVVWIAGRYDVMAGALLAWSLYYYLRFREPEVVNPHGLRTISLVLFGLACVSKELAFTFPVIILLYELIRVGDSQGVSIELKSRLKRILPYFIVAALILVLRLVRLGGIGGGEYVPETPADIFSASVLYHAIIQPLTVLLLPLNHRLIEAVDLSWVALVHVFLLVPLLLLLSGFRWRIIVFCVAATLICALPTAYTGILEESLRNSRFLYTPSIFFSILLAAIFIGAGKKEWVGRIAGGLAVIYLATLFLILNQNNDTWRKAGDMVQKASSSTVELIDRHNGEWGSSRTKLLIFNVPRTYIGALTFDWGLPQMLMLRYGDELNAVDIEVVHGGILTVEDVHKLDEAVERNAVVWFFNSERWEFVDYETIKH